MSLKDWMKKVESGNLNEAATLGVTPTSASSSSTATAPKVGQKVLVKPGAPQSAQQAQKPQTPGTPAQQHSAPPATMTTQSGKVVAQGDAAQIKKLGDLVNTGGITMTDPMSGKPIQEEDVMEVAPPGMEDVVLALKKKFPGHPEKAFAIAWHNYNKTHGKKSKTESVAEGKEMSSTQLNEGTLGEILANFPHEHKQCQEGWGMDSSLYEALCDHYYKEGRIPRGVWHGPLDELRNFVEECYMQDTMPIEEGEVGSALGRVAGSVAGAELGPLGSTVGGAIGSEIGDDIGDMIGEEEVEEGALQDFTMNARQADPRLDKYATDPKPTKLGQMMNKVSSGIKTAGSKVMNKLHPSDEELRRGPVDEESSLERDIRDSAMRSLKDEMDENMFEGKKPSAGLSKSEKSAVVKKAKAGGDIGKPGKGFEKVEKAAAKSGAKDPKAVAAAAMWKNIKREDIEEATTTTKTGRIHKAEAGGYGRKDDEDSEGKKVATAVKKGRGRPKKGGDETGEVKKFDFSALSKASGAKAPKDTKWDKKKTTSHRIATKADREEVDESQLNELSPKTLGNYVKKAAGDAKMKGYDAGAADWGGDEANTHPSKKKWAGAATDDKAHKRLKGISKAVDKMVGEGETIEKKGGRIHKGTYGTSHEAGDEGVKKVATQRGRGRPKKNADETGEVKKYDWSAFGVTKGSKLPKWDKNKTTKHKIKDESVMKSDPMLESWDAQLSQLLSEGVTKQSITEGKSISVSMGQEGGQDSVTISATDDDAHELLKMLQMSGISAQPGAEKAATMMAAPSTDGTVIDVEPATQDEVISDLVGAGEEDDNNALEYIKKMMGQLNGGSSEQSADQSGSETGEEEEVVDEVSHGEYISQQDDKAEASGKDKFKAFGQEFDTDEVEEDIDGEVANGDNEEEQEEEASDATRDAALAQAYSADNTTDEEVAEGEDEESGACEKCAHEECECEDEEKVEEGIQLDEWANKPQGSSKDETFETDIDFMTKFISGGLNNIKRDQTTVPSSQVVTKQEAADADASIAQQLRKLAGIN